MVNQSLFEESARPVLFEAACKDYTYWGLGSSVLVWTAETYFWITAKHVMENQGQSFKSLRVFPNDSSRMSLPFDALCLINSQGLDEDFTDLYILKIDLTDFAASGDAPLVAQDLDLGVHNPDLLTEGDELLIVGYPEESRSIDYEQFKIKYQRRIFKSKYIGPGEQRYCYTLKVKDNMGVTTYNGLSGAPVFRIVTQGAFSYPKLTGIILRGTATSQLCRFLGAHVIAHATKK